MQVTTVQLLAVLVSAAHAAAWVLGSRWERPGRRAPLRARSLPPLAARVGYAALVVPLLYPAVVVIAPGQAYEGWLNWSSRLDVAVQVAGLGLWTVGMIALGWATRVMHGYTAVDGVTEDHELVASGPYRYVRHPVYGSFTAIAAGLGLVFRSYVLVAVAGAWLAASMRWAVEEERLLGSSEGLGETYRLYSQDTGRFLPRLMRR